MQALGGRWLAVNAALQAACDYLARGWSVIPIRPGSKQPLVPWAEFQSRRATVAEVEGWFQRWPDAGVGIVTGKVSNLIVLDQDNPEALDGRECPLTPVAQTAQGYHWYFAHPGGVVRNFARRVPGLDLRADGGYVVAPPSRHPSGREYTWAAGFAPEEAPPAPCPAWLRDLLRDKPPAEERPPADDWQRPVEQGRRNDTLTRRAGTLLAHGVRPAQTLAMLLAYNARFCSPPLEEAEVRQIVDSIAAREGAKADGQPLDLNLRSAADLLRAELPERQDVLKDILPTGGLALLAGAPKSGKTLLALQLAIAVASGGTFLGRATTAGPVVVFSAEGGPQLLRERLEKMAPSPAALANLHLWWPTVRGLRLDDGADRQGLVEALATVGPRLIILDPLVRFHLGDENSTQEMAALMGCLMEVRNRTGAAILLVHHTRKLGKDARPGSAGEARGSSVLHGEVDAALVLERRRAGSEDQFVLHHELRWAAEPPPALLALDPASLRFEVTAEAKPSTRRVADDQIVEHLREHGPATADALATHWGVTKRTMQRYLIDLEKQGAVQRQGGTTTGRGRAPETWSAAPVQ